MGKEGEGRAPRLARSVIELYLKSGTARLSATRRAETERLLAEFAAHLGDRPWKACLKADLVLWAQSHAGWASDWTVKAAYAIAQRPFNWAADLGLIGHNPFRGASHPDGERRLPIGDDDFRRLLRAAAPCFRRALLFLRYSGCRPCEFRKITWPDVDTRRGVVVLLQHKSARACRERRPRLIALSTPLTKLLSWHARRFGAGDGPVFRNGQGRPWTRDALDKRLLRLRQRVGLPPTVKLYGCRHAFATQAVISGVDVKTLAELMGHSTTRMTEHYLHLAGRVDHLRAAAQRLLGTPPGPAHPF